MEHGLVSEPERVGGKGILSATSKFFLFHSSSPGRTVTRERNKQERKREKKKHSAVKKGQAIIQVFWGTNNGKKRDRHKAAQGKKVKQGTNYTCAQGGKTKKRGKGTGSSRLQQGRRGKKGRERREVIGWKKFDVAKKKQNQGTNVHGGPTSNLAYRVRSKPTTSLFDGEGCWEHKGCGS